MTTGCTVFEAGPWANMMEHFFPHPKLGRNVPGKVLLKNHLGMTGMEVSLGRLAPGAAVPFLHRHEKNEELYIFVRGRGEMRAGDAVIPVQEGTAVRFPPATARSWRNSGTEPLDYIVIQARENTMPTSTIEDGRAVEGDPWPKKA